MSHRRHLLCGLVLAAALILIQPVRAADDVPTLQGEKVASFVVPEARQAVAVDGGHFFAIDNQTIAKYDKKSGAKVSEWVGPKDGPIIHLDSGAVVDGKLYAAHSNYPEWPMTSSVEVWDATTLKHVDTFSFGIERGSLTWLDYHDGSWWGAFANYNRVFDRSPVAYGNKFNTQIVRFDQDWRVAEAWVLPEVLLDKFGDMSNSGGSWGPDGKLWISGHDLPEAYALEIPEMGSVMKWVAAAPLEIAGQGIAWDRSEPKVLFGIVRDKAKKENRVTATRINLP
ncbi:cycloisomerase [Mesorhizobium retamae]|uniref:Cycloisomerase n=1 Tax=Mesorhizobium retamae TaxID=2912854 RepID=A0ABS9QN94_9HYPH|nr:cycloisomerase [Mesorhizobium sp. IRAMC:0171]MCG7508785.1 cycloisomerase [Mesorhizobium sp. IRAMC:0171]